MAGDTVYYFTSNGVSAIYYEGEAQLKSAETGIVNNNVESQLQSAKTAIGNTLTKSASSKVRNFTLRCDTLAKKTLATNSSQKTEQSGPVDANFPGGDAYWQGQAWWAIGGIYYKVVFQANCATNLSGGWFLDVQNYLTHQSGSNWPLAGQSVQKGTYVTFTIYCVNAPYVFNPGYNDYRDKPQPDTDNGKDDIFVDCCPISGQNGLTQRWSNPSSYYQITGVDIYGYMYCDFPDDNICSAPGEGQSCVLEPGIDTEQGVLWDNTNDGMKIGG